MPFDLSTYASCSGAKPQFSISLLPPSTGRFSFVFTTMQASNSFKQVFLEKFLVGLQQGDLVSENMSLLDRKNAIKLSSDLALASARDGANWSRAIIADISKQRKNKALVRNILGKEFDSDQLTKLQNRSLTCKRQTCKRILRRSQQMRKMRNGTLKRMSASAVAKRMLKKRTQVLKCILPGGVSLNESSLVDEAIDYLFSLRAQVDVMRRLADIFQHSNGNQ